MVCRRTPRKLGPPVGEHLENSDHLTTHQSIFGTTDGEEMVSIGKDSESLSTYIAI